MRNVSQCIDVISVIQVFRMLVTVLAKALFVASLRELSEHHVLTLFCYCFPGHGILSWSAALCFLKLVFNAIPLAELQVIIN